MSKDKPDRLAIDGEGCRVAIIAARYNFQMVNTLLESVLQTLDTCGVRQEDVETFRVPGSNEIPHAASMIAKTGAFDVIIGLGLVIAGETDHHTIITHATASALQSVGVRFEVPVINGIISVSNEKQAADRISGELDRGSEFAYAALEMAQLNNLLQKRIFDEDANLVLDDLDWLDDLDQAADDDDESEDWKK
ncbi:6,7-dimethyl-8-ribityllumazine synthase [Puniceicoccales bacterium CK1056]|uniref:6,7-dimethyl-8-ribityllumazine synthase n=1 Tax=Oceanipulchritudo coccoides TaxID=2706888 RepID=A0A6B2LX97_9BACT|nr:6,7-dimethyl-8-ribityllumazine synthase [Oceanipulchritudo coccoides]NDV60833.1 6,7-dimethyl-8-ribityllumazine synthase [Oceanipulchritudo coccoides]